MSAEGQWPSWLFSGNLDEIQRHVQVWLQLLSALPSRNGVRLPG